ncbi:hypothetical protein Tco_0355124 [Tanacetum coccineum]
MVIVSNTTLEVISLLWISRTSKPSLRTTNSGNWVKLSDPKQALRGRGAPHHAYPVISSSRCPGFLKPLVLAVFVLRSQELHNPQLHLGIPIS